MPLHSVIVPKSVSISETPFSAEVSSAEAAEPARFATSASISEATVIPQKSPPMIPSPFRIIPDAIFAGFPHIFYFIYIYIYIASIFHEKFRDIFVIFFREWQRKFL